MRPVLLVIAIILVVLLGPKSWSAFKAAYNGYDEQYDKFAESVASACNGTIGGIEPMAPPEQCKVMVECYRQGIEGVYTRELIGILLSTPATSNDPTPPAVYEAQKKLLNGCVDKAGIVHKKSSPGG